MTNEQLYFVIFIPILWNMFLLAIGMLYIEYKTGGLGTNAGSDARRKRLEEDRRA